MKVNDTLSLKVNPFEISLEMYHLNVLEDIICNLYACKRLPYWILPPETSDGYNRW